MAFDRRLTAFLHSRGALLLMVLLLAGAVWFAVSRGEVPALTGEFGPGFPSPNLWIQSPVVSGFCAVILSATAAFLAVAVNRGFNVLRSLTSLGGSLFLAFQVSLPQASARLGGGMLLTLCMLLCTALLFSTFGYRMCQRRVFLIFCLLGAAGFVQTGFFYFMPAMLLGCVQMRTMNLRTLLAALLGAVTPVWILAGFGVIDPAGLRWPEMCNVWETLDRRELLVTPIAIGFTVVTGISFGVANLMKILSYNSRVRAFNGFFSILLPYTVLLLALDFNNYAFYVPLLNLLAAYQVAHFFTYRRQRRSCYAILAIMLCCFALYFAAI